MNYMPDAFPSLGHELKSHLARHIKTWLDRVISLNSLVMIIESMLDGSRCEICSVVYGTESTIRYKPVGRSNFRFQCEGRNRDNLVHKFTIDGKLYRRTKRVHNADMQSK